MVNTCSVSFARQHVKPRHSSEAATETLIVSKTPRSRAWVDEWPLPPYRQISYEDSEEVIYAVLGNLSTFTAGMIHIARSAIASMQAALRLAAGVHAR